MMSRFASAMQFFGERENLERLMKNFGWCMALAVMPKVALANADIEHLKFGILAWAAFFIFMALNMGDALNNIVDPLMKKIYGKEWSPTDVRRKFRRKNSTIARIKFIGRVLSTEPVLVCYAIFGGYFYLVTSTVELFIKLKL